jgi:hypothetical protein
MADRHKNHQLFLTREGELGLGPDYMAQGDLICALAGYQSLVLLREVDGHFVSVGSCFVMALTEDAPAKLLEAGKIEIEEFEIH